MMRRSSVLLLVVVVISVVFLGVKQLPQQITTTMIVSRGSATQLLEVPHHAPQDVTSSEALPSAPPNETIPDFRWTGGGVEGMTEGNVNVGLDQTQIEVAMSFETFIGVSIGEYQNDNIVNKATVTRRADFAKYFDTNVVANTNKDCFDRMNAHQQLLCHAWAEVQGKQTTSSNRSRLFSGAPLQSMCSLFLGCLLWKRGRYSRTLTVDLLRTTFRGLVADMELYNSSRLMQRNLIHGGDNWREYDWLQDRLVLSRDLVNSVNSSPIDVRRAFQGGEMTVQIDRDKDGWTTRRFATRGNGDVAMTLTRPLTALETIAVLHHRAVSGSDQHTILYSGGSPDRPCRIPTINALIFSGDSVAKQLFRRLIDIIRHGPQGRVMVPYGDELLPTNFHYWPSLDHSKCTDIVLVVYPTHDEFHTFESLMPWSVVTLYQPYVRTNRTTNAFFAAIAEQRRRRYCNHSGTSDHSPDEDALMYLVYLCDALTVRPRKDAMAPCTPTPPTVGDFPPLRSLNFERLQKALTLGMDLVASPPPVPLRALGVRIGLHVHAANMWEMQGSPSTYDWLSRMATGCNVSGQAHPPSDNTLLYLVGANVWLRPPHSISKLRVAPKGAIAATASPGQRLFYLSPDDQGYEQLARQEAPFEWLRRTTAAIERPGGHHNAEHSGDGIFFSRLRLLDIGKVFLGTGTVFRAPDGLHELCGAHEWLVGAAGNNRDATVARLLQMSTRLTAAVSSVVPPSKRSFNSIVLAFDPRGDCALFGSVVALNAMLIDVIDTARRGP
jgi:hypothetical protein